MEFCPDHLRRKINQLSSLSCRQNKLDVLLEEEHGEGDNETDTVPRSPDLREGGALRALALLVECDGDLGNFLDDPRVGRVSLASCDRSLGAV